MIVIIGNGISGVTAARNIRKNSDSRVFSYTDSHNSTGSRSSDCSFPGIEARGVVEAQGEEGIT